MTKRAFERLESHEGHNNLANVSPLSVGGTSFSMVIFGAPLLVSSQPSVASKSKGKKGLLLHCYINYLAAGGRM